MRAAFVLAMVVSSCTAYGTEAPVTAPSPERDGGASDGGSASIEPVHVAPFGRDFAEGTAEAPVVTFARALALSAQHGGADIVVCAGTYEENVAIDRSVRVFGNRSCDGWKVTNTRARIAPPAGVPLSIGATTGVHVEGMEVIATADHTISGSSAVGVFVTGSSNVVLRNVKITSSAGIDGDSSPPARNWSDEPPPSQAASGTVGGTGPKNTCSDGSWSLAGNGATVSSTPATAGSASTGIGAINAGASGSACSDGGNGADGASASAGEALGSPFEITSKGLVARRGADGGKGMPAQGGGGGGATSPGGGGGGSEGGGGSGGAGGCGGAGGPGGESGGSSIALLVFESAVVVEESELAARDGGRGANGAPGQAGQGGGGGAIGAGDGCSGGGGGHGGNGAGGGGGAGGFSAAVVHVGARPNLTTTTTTTTGAAGEAGAGGPGGVASLSGKAGATGKAGDVIAF